MIDLRLRALPLLLLLLVPLPAPALAGASGLSLRPAAGSAAGPMVGTLVLRGRMESQVQLVMTGAFSVGRASNLVWDLPRLTPVRIVGYREKIRALDYQFTIPPDRSEDLVVNHLAVHRVTWFHPPADTVIQLRETVLLWIRSELNPFASRRWATHRALPAAVRRFRRPTALTRLPRPLQPLLRHLRRSSERATVGAVTNWVASHVSYDPAAAAGPYDAASVLARHGATCLGYANLTASLLRALRIPVQVVYGWVAATPLRLPGPRGDWTTLQWGAPGSAGELHAWLIVYFPGLGWVPLDPQREKFFIDARHLAFLMQPEAGVLSLGAWSADRLGSASVTGPRLPGGNVEILPGDGVSSRVSVRTSDSIHLAFRSVRHDVHHLVLFSR